MHMIIAEIYEARGERNKALEHYEISARQKDARPDAYVRMAIITSDSDPKAALKILDRAEQRFAMDEMVVTAVAYLAKKNDISNDVIDLLGKFAERCKGPLPQYFFLHLGGSYEQTARFDKAAEVFQKGLKAYPDSHEIMNYLAYMWAEQGENLDEGEKLSQKALSLDPANGAYLDTLGWIYYMKGQDTKALEYIRKALRYIPDDSTVIEHLGDVLAKQGKLTEAIEQWKRSYSIDPSNDELDRKIKKHSAPEIQTKDK